MKNFAGSRITYYGLVHEKVMNRYPRLIGVLTILALICMTCLAIFLISDLISFASNPDHKGILVGLDIKDLENGIVSMKDGKEKSGNIGANFTQAVGNLSSQTKKQNSTNLSQIKSSSSKSQKISDDNSNKSPVKKHHSSSSSSSSAKSEKKSMNNSQTLNNSYVEPTAIAASIKASESIIKFNAKTTPAPKFEQGPSADGTAISESRAQSDPSGREGNPVVDNRAQRASLRKSEGPAPIQAKKIQAQRVQEARAKQTANKNRIAESMKKRGAQARA
jgi:hypothetical protein